VHEQGGRQVRRCEADARRRRVCVRSELLPVRRKAVVRVFLLAEVRCEDTGRWRHRGRSGSYGRAACWWGRSRRCHRATTTVNLDCQRSLLQLWYKHRLQIEQGSSAAHGRRCLVHRRGQDGGEEFGAIGVREVRAAEWVRAARWRACPSSVRRQAKRLSQNDMR
jgi:hypothetical protein